MKNKKSTENEIINIKVEHKDQIFSTYSYDANDKLNKDLSEYIIEKTKHVGVTENIELHFYTKEHFDVNKIKSVIKNHFNEEYLDAKRELKKSNTFAFLMFLLGIGTLAILLAVYKHFSNFYFEMILEIASWVFIWTAVEMLFMYRPKNRKKCIILKKICSAEIEIITEN